MPRLEAFVPRARGLAAAGVALLALGLAACGGGGAPAPATTSTASPAPSPAAPPVAPAGQLPAAAVAEAEQIFATRCVPCHGPQGHGDGPASAALAPPPRNFGLAEWQASVTDEHIETIVKYGGASVGKAPTMPGNPDLIAKPDVVKALRAHVRSLKQ